MANTLEILPDIEATHDVKILAVTSPQLFEELRRDHPAKAAAIFPDEERQFVVALHNGWRGFLYPFLLPGDHTQRTFGMDDFSRSGSPKEIYHHAAFDPAGIREKILSAVRL
jgi:transketolase